MTSLSINTQSNNINTLLSMPTASYTRKLSTPVNNLFSYLASPKTNTKKSTARIFQIDWDVNMNELEFE